MGGSSERETPRDFEEISLSPRHIWLPCQKGRQVYQSLLSLTLLILFG